MQNPTTSFEPRIVLYDAIVDKPPWKSQLSKMQPTIKLDYICNFWGLCFFSTPQAYLGIMGDNGIQTLLLYDKILPSFLFFIAINTENPASQR